MLPFSDADTHHRSFPVVNVSLIGISALVFLYELMISGFAVIGGGNSQALTEFFFTWGFIPEELMGEAHTILPTRFGRISVETPTPTWTTIFSSLFMHGGLMHLASNMMFLWVFGDTIEDRMGHVKYLGFYLAAGVVATLSHWLIDPGSAVPLIGASGAIAGVLGAYLFTFPYNRVKALLIVIIFITVIQLRAMWLLAIWFGWQLIQGVLSLGIPDQVTVAFFAHIGGFVFGAGVIVLYRLATRQPIWPPRYSLAPPSSQFWRGRPLD